METLKLKKDLYWCGVQDPNLRVFDVIMETKYGTSYNSFLLKGWLVTLITVVLALTKDSIISSDLTYLTLTLCLPVLVFWYLDAFFLYTEKLYLICLGMGIEEKFIYPSGLNISVTKAAAGTGQLSQRSTTAFLVGNAAISSIERIHSEQSI